MRPDSDFLTIAAPGGERWLTEAVDACLTDSERAHLIKAGALLDRIMAYPRAAMPRGGK